MDRCRSCIQRQVLFCCGIIFLICFGVYHRSFSPSGLIPQQIGSVFRTAQLDSIFRRDRTVLAAGSPNESAEEAQPKLLCVRFIGRLGNELFQYASTLGLAFTLTRTPVFLDSQHLVSVLKYFGDPLVDYGQLRARCSKARLIVEKSCCAYDERLLQIDPTEDFTVEGFLQSYQYFHRYQTTIRWALTFSDAVQTEASQLTQNLRRSYNSSTLIGVHLRRGDMAIAAAQAFGYPVADEAYVFRAMYYYKARYPDAVFVVSSDSQDWWMEKLANVSDVLFLPQSSPAVDMLTLASLDHTLVSFGTFTWWVGYFNRGQTVHMKDFILNGTGIGRSFSPGGSGYIYPGWVLM